MVGSVSSVVEHNDQSLSITIDDGDPAVRSRQPCRDTVTVCPQGPCCHAVQNAAAAGQFVVTLDAGHRGYRNSARALRAVGPHSRTATSGNFEASRHLTLN